MQLERPRLATMHLAIVLYIAYAIFLLLPGTLTLNTAEHTPTGGYLVLHYGYDQLCQLREYSDRGSFPLNVPEECVRRNRRVPTRMRGQRGGVRWRVRRRGHKPPLPTMLLANVCSLLQQYDKLQTAVRYLSEYRESCLLCFIETWLNDTIINESICIPGFSEPIRLDRDLEVTEKETGGRVCIFVNERWCKDYKLRDSYCSEDVELLSVSFRPFYLPREHGQIFTTLVYIHPHANMKAGHVL